MERKTVVKISENQFKALIAKEMILDLGLESIDLKDVEIKFFNGTVETKLMFTDLEISIKN